MVNYHRDRLTLAKQARNTPDRRMDNLTFLQDFYSNEDAVNSYLRPKINDDEVRVVGGTTEKRIESIVNELQGMNYQHEIQAFDTNDAELRGLGKSMEDVVTRTNQLGNEQQVAEEAVWELCTQRGVVIEEILEEKQIANKIIRTPKKRLRSLLEVIFGDLTMPWYALQEQPFIATYDRMSLQSARMFYGHYDNFKHVRGGQDLSIDVYGAEITFRLGILLQDEVEVIHYMSVPDNEEQLYINGVPMLPVGSSLQFQYPCPRYPLAFAIPKRMSHHYTLGRSMAASLKYLQALDDETTRNLIRKFRQAVEPPKAVKSNAKSYTRDMYVAGSISYGVDADALKSLTKEEGITQGEMVMKQMVRQMIDELAARSDIQSGVTPDKKQTATAVVEQQKQAIKMLGQLVLAYSYLVRQMTENRVFNVIENLSKPDEVTFDPTTEQFVEQFRRFTLKNQPLENGKSGDRVLQMIGRDLTPEEELAIDDWQENEAAEGRPVKLSVLNIKRLRKMAVNWYVTVASKPRDSDDLHKLMFQDKLTQAGAIAQATGKQINSERVIDEFEQVWRADDWFKDDIESVQPMPGMEEQGGSEMKNQAQAGIMGAMKRPAKPAPKLTDMVGAPQQ